MKKTTKLISILLVLAMLLSMAPISVFAATVEASGKFGASSNNLTWSLDSDGVLTVSGNGAMQDFANAASVPWYSKRTKVKTVVIESGVTNIGKDAFYGISALVNATISDTVTSIGNRAFSNSGLTNFEFSDAGNLKTIGNSAFNSTKIKSMVIPDGVTTLGSYVFGYGPIQSVTIPASVTSVGNYFFEETSSLNEVIFLGNKEPETIGNMVFLSCSSLAYVSVPADYEGDTFSNMKVSKAVASVAEVNGQGFATLVDAISAAQSINGAELKLLSHISIDSGITIESGKFTIDLNGKELFSNGYFLLRIDGADVTIVDSAGGGIFSATNDQGNIVLEVLSGSANISGGTFNSAGYPATVKGGTLKLTGKDFVLNGNWRIGWYGGSIDLSACTADEVRIQACADGLLASAVTLPDGWGLFETDGTPCTDFVKNEIYVAKAGYKVTAYVNPAEGGTVEGAGTYGSGATVNLTASAADGYRFVNWTQNGEKVSTSAVYTFTASGNRELTANFEIVPHTHSFTYSAGGDTITAICANTDGSCPDSEGTLTISAPADLYADGTTAKEATVENNLVDTSVVVDITYSTADGSAPKTAGTYTASVTVGGVTASVQFELVKRSAAADNFIYTAPENLVYDGTAKYATVEVSPEITGLGEITVAYYKDGEAAEPIDAGTYTVKVSTADSDKYYAINDVELASFIIEKKAVTVSATVPDRIYGESVNCDTTKVVITFDGIVEGDDVGYVVTDAWYHAHTVTNNAPVPVVYNVNGADAENYQFPEFGEYLAPEYGVEATGRVLPRDIANAEITLGDVLVYNGAEQTQTVAAVTVDGLEVTYTVSGNKATSVGVYELTIAGNGNFAGEATALYEVAPDTTPVVDLTVDNVKSSDKEDIEAVKAQIENAVTDLADDEKKVEYKAITDECEELLAKINDTVAEIERIDEAVSGYDAETVTSADVPELSKLIGDIKALADSDNLTEDEKATLEEADKAVDALVEKLAEVAEEIKRVDEAVKSYEEETVKSTDSDELAQIKEDIQNLIDSDNTTENVKTDLEDMIKDIEGFEDKIEEIETQLEEIKDIENNFNPENVSSDDKAAIEDKIAEIEEVNPDNLTDEQQAEYEEIKAGFEALLEKIAAAEKDVAYIGVELEMFDEKRVTKFWEDDIEALKAKIDKLLADENMGEAEKTKLNEYKAQCDKLIEIINTPIKYFSFRFFYFIWDCLTWKYNGILWLFSKIFG